MELVLFPISFHQPTDLFVDSWAVCVVSKFTLSPHWAFWGFAPAHQASCNSQNPLCYLQIHFLCPLCRLWLSAHPPGILWLPGPFALFLKYICQLGGLFEALHPPIRPLVDSQDSSFCLQNNFFSAPPVGRLWLCTSSLRPLVEFWAVHPVSKVTFCPLGKLQLCACPEGPLWTPRIFHCFGDNFLYLLGKSQLCTYPGGSLWNSTPLPCFPICLPSSEEIRALHPHTRPSLNPWAFCALTRFASVFPHSADGWGRRACAIPKFPPSAPRLPSACFHFSVALRVVGCSTTVVKQPPIGGKSWSWSSWHLAAWEHVQEVKL